MDLNNKVSVIVPVYNVEQWLARCVDSILAQTYTNLEIILVDDASPDQCGALCDAYANMDNRIIVIHQENAGVAKARNAGLSVATGAYIGFADSDDWIEPTMYEELVSIILERHCDIAVCEYDEVDEDGLSCSCSDNIAPIDMDRERYLQYIIEAVRPSRDVVWNKLFRKEILDGFTFDCECRIGEDRLFLFESSERVRSVCRIEKALYHYFKRTGSLTNSRDAAKRVVALPAHKRVAAYAKTVNREVFQIAEASFLDICLQYFKHPTAKTELREYIQKNKVSFLRNSRIPWKLKLVYLQRAFCRKIEKGD